MSARRNSFSNPDDELNAFANTATAAAESEALDDIMDFTQVDERLAGQFPTLDPGTYDAKVVKVEYGHSKSGAKNPMWTWQLSVTNPETGRNHNLRYWTMLTKPNAAVVKRDIMRVAPELNMEGMNLREVPAEFEGRRCRVKVKLVDDRRPEYKGLKQNSVQEILSPDDNAENFDSFL